VIPIVEFGSSTCDSTAGGAFECHRIMDLCDQHFVSWMHWVGLAFLFATLLFNPTLAFCSIPVSPLPNASPHP
jgi:hypothetical protein